MSAEMASISEHWKSRNAEIFFRTFLGGTGILISFNVPLYMTSIVVALLKNSNYSLTILDSLKMCFRKEKGISSPESLNFMTHG